MDSPFKIIVDSRSASEGHGGKFSYSLPRCVQVPPTFCCYVSQASISNTFLSVGTFIGNRHNTFYWFERIAGNDTVFNKCELVEQNYDIETLSISLQHAINASS